MVNRGTRFLEVTSDPLKKTAAKVPLQNNTNNSPYNSKYDTRASETLQSIGFGSS